MTMLVGLGMGVVYMLVDYGVFHLICHSRSISDEYSLFWVLLWMSMSYGFTNFTWIWLCLSKDEHLPEWSLLILSWWFCCPLLTQTFVLNAVPIVIQRTTGAYHGYMALILFVGYLGAIVYDLRQQQMAQQAKPVGRVTFADGSRMDYTDAQEYLRCIQKELPQHSVTGFRYETLTDDPVVRKQVDDILFDLYGEENPQSLTDYENSSGQGMKMGGM